MYAGLIILLWYDFVSSTYDWTIRMRMLAVMEDVVKSWLLSSYTINWIWTDLICSRFTSPCFEIANFRHNNAYQSKHILVLSLIITSKVHHNFHTGLFYVGSDDCYEYPRFNNLWLPQQVLELQRYAGVWTSWKYTTSLLNAVNNTKINRSWIIFNVNLIIF